jgi:hypothetical protein
MKIGFSHRPVIRDSAASRLIIYPLCLLIAVGPTGYVEQNEIGAAGFERLERDGESRETRTMSAIENEAVKGFASPGPNHRALWRSDGRWKGTRVERTISLGGAVRSTGRRRIIGSARSGVSAVRIFLAMVFVLLMSTAVHAATWYLMAADVDEMSNPSVADRMSKGSILGPLQLTSQAEFPSREKCEPARDALVDAWRRRSVIKRGGWDKYGIATPAGFVRCVPDTDPHLTKSRADDRAGKGPSLDVLLRKGRVR